MDAYELPLVFFTVLSQWAVGIVISVSLLEWLKPDYMKQTGKQTLRPSVYFALGISVVSTLVSMFHINNPLMGYKSLIGLGHSWLSREILAVILFNLCLIVLTYLWWKQIDKDNLRRGIGTLTAIVGIALVITTSMVYFSNQLHPAWNNWTTFANFLLTGLLLGALTVTFFAFRNKQADEKTGVMKLLSIYLAIMIVALFVTIGSSALISSGTSSSQMAAMISFTSVLFWIRILGSLLIPASLVIYFLIENRSAASSKYILAAMAFVLIGELSGRAMFYYSVMSQYPWF